MAPVTALALFGTLGTPELIIILIILVLIFGATKLPQLGSAMGKTIRNFKSEMKDGMAEEPKNGKAETSAARYCPKCGADVADPEAAFCPKCGKAL